MLITNCKFDTEITCMTFNANVTGVDVVAPFDVGASPEPVFWSVARVPFFVEDDAQLEVVVVTG